MEALAKRVLSFAQGRRDAREHHERWSWQHSLRGQRDHARAAARMIPSSRSLPHGADAALPPPLTLRRRLPSARRGSAERLARLSPEDPELVPELGPQPTRRSMRPMLTCRTLTRPHAPVPSSSSWPTCAQPGGAMPVDPASLLVAGFLERAAALARSRRHEVCSRTSRARACRCRARRNGGWYRIRVRISRWQRRGLQ